MLRFLPRSAVTPTRPLPLLRVAGGTKLPYIGILLDDSLARVLVMPPQRTLIATLLLGALVASLVVAFGFGLQPSIAERGDAPLPAHLSLRPLFEGVDWGPGSAAGPGSAYALADVLLRRLTIVVVAFAAIVAGLGQLALIGVRAVTARSELRLRRALGAERVGILKALVRQDALGLRDALIVGGFLGAAAWLALISGQQADALMPVIGTPSVPSVAVPVFALALAWTAVSFLIMATGEALPGRPLQKACPLGEPFRGEVCHPGVPVLQAAGATFILVSAGILARGAFLDAPAGAYAIDRTTDRVTVRVRSPAALDLLEEAVAGLRADRPVALTSPGFWESAGHLAYSETECGRCIIPGSPPVLAPYKGEIAVLHAVNPDTFDLAGIVVLEGRPFTAQDRRDSDPVAVVSRGFALEHFQDGQAIGRRVRIGSRCGGVQLERCGTWHTVVGVIQELPRQTLPVKQLPSEDVLVPISQVTSSEVELVGAGVASLASIAQGQGLVTGGPEPIDRRWDAMENWLGWYRAVWIWFGRGALAIAIFGMGVTVARRVHELGPEFAVRRAVGATRLGLSGEQLGFGLRIGAIGAGLGAWAALFTLSAVYPEGLGEPTFLVSDFLLPALTIVGIASLSALVSAYEASGRIAT
jgi:hypothetical protein